MRTCCCLPWSGGSTTDPAPAPRTNNYTDFEPMFKQDLVCKCGRNWFPSAPPPNSLAPSVPPNKNKTPSAPAKISISHEIYSQHVFYVQHDFCLARSTTCFNDSAPLPQTIVFARVFLHHSDLQHVLGTRHNLLFL